MTRVRVELAGAASTCTHDLDTDLDIAELLPTLVTLVGDGPAGEGAWFVTTAAGRRIEPGTNLAAAGIAPGDTLFVARNVTALDWERGPTQDRGCWVPPLPEHLGIFRRVTATADAFFGVSRLGDTIDAPPWARARSMWAWTDMGRRLRWLIGRPKLRRTVMIGVVSIGSGGAEVAMALAEALAAYRQDRVVLLDGEPKQGSATSMMPGRRVTVGEVARSSVALDARFGAVGFVGVGSVSHDECSPATYRAAIERIRHHAALVVIDCGQIGSAPLADMCDQIVLVTSQPIGHSDAVRFGGRRQVMVIAGGVPADRARRIARSMPQTPVDMSGGDAALQIAAMLAGGWDR
jgi:hypothetical protein